MSTHRYIDKICCVAVAVSLIITAVFMNASFFGITQAEKTSGYEKRLFDSSYVHTIDIVMNDWDLFIENCTNEQYSLCSIVIDNEAYKNTAIRAKGNTSLSQVEKLNSERYSFKIEFDHYDSSNNYYGLDKLSLNNIIQDNTYMKDYIVYQMMEQFGTAAPLCSFVNITVNGEAWGLYLAVEGIEEAFLERNYTSDYGELYKPDSMDMPGERENAGKFDIQDEPEQDIPKPDGDAQNTQKNIPPQGRGAVSDDTELRQRDDKKSFEDKPPDGEMPRISDENPPENNGKENKPEDEISGDEKSGFGKGDGKNSSDDTKLIYSDDDYESYKNIFDNAKTDITGSDKDRLISSLKQLCNNENIENVVNVDEVIRYFVVHNFVCNFDSYTGSLVHNYYLYEKDCQLSMIAWDYNLAFGGFNDVKDANELVNYPIDSPVSNETVDSRPMLAWIFNNEEYTNLYHEYFSQFIDEYIKNGYLSKMINSVRDMIAPYVQDDVTKFCTYEEFCTGVDTLEKFCNLRGESVSAQLDGTIPSTATAQKSDSENLIDAGDIDISSMGSMNANSAKGRED